MNGKAAKRMRREAERQTVGKPWVAMQVHPIVEDRMFRKPTGSVMLEHSPKSGRGIYNSLKKEYNDGSR